MRPLPASPAASLLQALLQTSFSCPPLNSCDVLHSSFLLEFSQFVIEFLSQFFRQHHQPINELKQLSHIFGLIPTLVKPFDQFQLPAKPLLRRAPGFERFQMRHNHDCEWIPAGLKRVPFGGVIQQFHRAKFQAQAGLTANRNPAARWSPVDFGLRSLSELPSFFLRFHFSQLAAQHFAHGALRQ